MTTRSVLDRYRALRDLVAASVTADAGDPATTSIAAVVLATEATATAAIPMRVSVATEISVATANAQPATSVGTPRRHVCRTATAAPAANRLKSPPVWRRSNTSWPASTG